MKNNISFPSAESCVIMEPQHSNSLGNVHGGVLMKMMDDIAGLAALKQAKGAVVTARVDELVFHQPIHIGDIVTCIGQVAYVGHSSIQVMVSTLVHEIEDYKKSRVAMTAFFTMVHLKSGKPAKVEPLVPRTEEEEKIYQLGEAKYKEIKEKFTNKLLGCNKDSQ